MGCWYSRLIDKEEMVSRCKARKRYMKQFVKSRHTFSAAHSMYLRSLRNTGSAILQFATSETNLHTPPPPHLTPSPPPLLPHPPPPMSPTSWTTTTTTSTNASSAVQPPPPPPPPVPASSTWDFWDPFMPTSGRSADEEEWEETTTTTATVTASEAAPTTTTTAGARSMTAPPSLITATATTSSSELAVVVSTKSKDLVEIIQELGEYFFKAAKVGGTISTLLEVPTCNINGQASTSKDYRHSPLLWTWGSRSVKWSPVGKFCEEDPTANIGSMGADGKPTHRSTVERLYAWEKKLYQEVKNAEYLKLEHDKKSTTLRKLEMKNADYFKSEKAKKEVEKLESQMMVASQAIETTSAEIIKLRESELSTQLLELVKGLMSMWRSMYEFHQVQMHIVQQLKYLNCIPSTNPTSEIHRQSTLQLELEAQQWHLSFCNLIKAQRDYVQSLIGWLRLSLFQVGNNTVHKTRQESVIYSLCEEWQLAINNAPDKVASEGIKSFLTVIHAIVVQQAEEQKQKKRSDTAFKELEKKVVELRSLENKYGPYRDKSKDPVREKRAKVDTLRAKAEDEKGKYVKSISVTRAMTMNNLQMGLPHVFQAMTGFANVCAQAFESVHNQAKSTEDLHNVKMILP
ncbi:hypothetical protein ACJIZ3_023655 [Penstemon smallii]|uniref:DUF632 domain-containing protein n=1 Tax=Penstemon smallii TaxID=265156 RepID=A0ABD3TPP6_9LAMI